MTIPSSHLTPRAVSLRIWRLREKKFHEAQREKDQGGRHLQSQGGAPQSSAVRQGAHRAGAWAARTVEKPIAENGLRESEIFDPWGFSCRYQHEKPQGFTVAV